MKAASRYHRRMARFQRLLLLALLLFVAGCATRPAGVSHPPLLLISIDALRPSDVDATQMPTLNALADAGVRAAWMTPSYPSKTFPNHYTLVTGLRPDHHGMINNTMYDPELGSFNLQSREAVQDPRWWTGGEPVWITLQHHGGRAATMFWPGSEAAIQGQHPLDWRIYDESVSANARVDQVLAWLDRPERTRPQFITLYFEQVDEAGHKSGPDSAESRAARKEVDDALARLLAGLEQRGLRDGINLVVVSDHGMANITGREYIIDYLQAHGLGLDAIRITTSGALAGITPKPGQEAAVEAALLGRHPHSTCWRKQEMPAQWHYGSHPRIPPIQCQADLGWLLLDRDNGRPFHGGGAHGYAIEEPTMHATFIASGPAFRDHVALPAFDNVDVYPLLMRLLGLQPLPNDGDITPLLPALKTAP